MTRRYSRRPPGSFAQLRSAKAWVSFSSRFPCPFGRLHRAIAWVEPWLPFPKRPHCQRHGKALASPIRSLDFASAKAWQTLALSVHLVRSSETRLSLSYHTCSTSTRPSCQHHFDHDMLQQCSIQSTYDSPYGLPTTTTTCSIIAASSPRTTG